MENTDNKMKSMEKRSAFRKFMTKEKLIPLIIFIGMCVFIGAINPLFFTWQTWQNLFAQVSSVGIIAFGAMFVITSGGLDFTAGDGVSLAGVIAATSFVASGMNNVVTIVVGCLIGALMGACNSLLIVRLKIQPFIATLSVMTIIKGFLLAVSEGTIIHMDVKGATFTEIGQGVIQFPGAAENVGVPICFIIFIGVAVVVWFILNRTKFGQATMAMGGNEEAARLAGVRVDFFRFWVYTFAGLLTGLGAVITLSKVAQVGISLGGTTLLMDVVAAAVIGGTSVSGGRCNVFGVVLGTFIVISISTAMVYLNIDTNWREVVKGVLIIVALLIDIIAVNVSKKMEYRRKVALREARRKLI